MISEYRRVRYLTIELTSDTSRFFVGGGVPLAGNLDKFWDTVECTGFFVGRNRVWEVLLLKELSGNDALVYTAGALSMGDTEQHSPKCAT